MTPTSNSPEALVERLRRYVAAIVCADSDLKVGPAMCANAMDDAAAQITALSERRDTLFDAVKHGDDDHKEWLREAIDAHFAGQPVPAPRGSGNKEAKITALSERLAAVRSALERVDRNFDLLLAGKPVRDVCETKAETRAALTDADQAQDQG